MKIFEVTKEPERRNPVAKNAAKFNKSGAHKDRTKYTRKEKHKKPAA